MKIPTHQAISRRIRKLVRTDPDRFLKHVSGLIHVGANIGQERDLYERHGLRVIWIEPIPEVFETLKANLEGFPRQRAFEYLVTDRDDAVFPFHIASNDGASSSILDLKEHKDIWPNIGYTKTITLKSVTLASLLHRERVDPAGYDALIMDTQGSELLVLKGADPVLHNFRFIKTEVADFESYAGCCQLTDIDSFLTRRGYRELARTRIAQRAGGGSYYDIVYQR
jgi:FkbM family methyltransferase